MNQRVLVDGGFSVVHTITASSLPSHSHSEYVVSHYLSGHAACRVAPKGVLEFKPGETALLNPGEVHQDYPTATPRSYLMVNIRKEFFQELIRDSGRPREMPLFPFSKLKKDGDVNRIFKTLSLEVQEDGFARLIVIRSLVTELAVYLLRLFTPSPTELENYRLEVDKARYPVRRVFEYLRDHFAQHLDLDDLASVAGLSKYHLERVFKEATGLSPHTYMLLLRVERAKELLAISDEPIAAIASSLNFSHQSHFTNVFKKFTGVTPGAYRAGAK
jgi:AraC-like DNA-binding protein